MSSPNGILLFRETSKMITTYGTDFPLILLHQIWTKKKKECNLLFEQACGFYCGVQGIVS